MSDRLPRGDTRVQTQLDALSAGQVRIELQAALQGQSLKNLERDVDKKHQDNRKEFHALRGLVQTLIDDIWKMKLANARWNIGAGILTACLIKLIEKFWH